MKLLYKNDKWKVYYAGAKDKDSHILKIESIHCKKEYAYYSTETNDIRYSEFLSDEELELILGLLKSLSDNISLWIRSKISSTT